jgi:hypothetical protein
MELNKKDLDEAIRLSKSFFKKGGDNDTELDKYIEAKKKVFGKVKRRHYLDNIITGITLKRADYNEPYKTYYKVLEALGFEIVEG